MKIESIKTENIAAAWTLFQELMAEQKTEKFVKIDFDGFKAAFFNPQLTTVKGLIGYEEGRPIALATYCYSFTIYRGQPVLAFKTFYVAKDYRRKGYGRQILKYLSDEATENDCAYIQWNVYEANVSAKSYYASMDFDPDGELLNYLVSPQDLKQKIS